MYDSNPSCISGLENEFISSGRLDNLGSSIPAIHTLMNNNPANHAGIDIVAVFDNEECGSESYQGCDNVFFSIYLKRIFESISDFGEKTSDSFDLCCARSFVISADMAHCVNPNYSDKHHSQHSISMHTGVVLKLNPNGRYATDSEGSSIMKHIAKKADVPLQVII